jgi:hypothetical protein
MKPLNMESVSSQIRHTVIDPTYVKEYYIFTSFINTLLSMSIICFFLALILQGQLFTCTKHRLFSVLYHVRLILLRVSVIKTRFGLVTGFIGSSLAVTTISSYTIKITVTIAYVTSHTVF